MKTKEPTAPKLACIFYQTDAGTAPARDWLREQPPAVKKKIGDDIRVVQYAWPLERPLVGRRGAGLFEVRTSHFDNDYRVLFSISEGKMLILLGAQKPVSKDEMDLARTRKRDADRATMKQKGPAAAKVKKKGKP